MSLRLLLRAVAGLVASYALLCLLVFLLQRKLQYFPETGEEGGALRRAAAAGLGPWRSSDGRLLGWRPLGGTPAALRVLVFHGNAGNALDRAYYVALGRQLGAEVVLMEYPGYGARAGEITEASLVAAGREAVARLAPEGPLVVLGESLGSGVACQVAAAEPSRVRGLLLVTPYLSMAEVGARAYPWLPVSLLMRDRWDNRAALAKYSGPVGILVAGRDEVVGADQGRALAGACRGPHRLVVQPEAGHNTFSLAPQAGWAELLSFATAGS
jgi:pimeloyl-ACP methyl ester carboxylesterase